jgi:hypothetical protein
MKKIINLLTSLSNGNYQHKDTEGEFPTKEQIFSTSYGSVTTTKFCTVAMLQLPSYTLLHNLHTQTQFTGMLDTYQTTCMYGSVCYLRLSNCKLNQLLAMPCRCFMVHKAIPLKTVTYNTNTSRSRISEATVHHMLELRALFYCY